jgi:hypothetical protein
LSNEKSGTHREPPWRRYLRVSAGKSSKSGAFLTGKMIPSTLVSAAKRVERTAPPHRYSGNTKTGGSAMYIGLGGLLILILILWLLGVI